jgi:hypothetical protein
MEAWLLDNAANGKRRSSDGDDDRPYKVKKVPHKALLVNTFATALTVYYGCLPGSTRLTEALQAIATYVVASPNTCESMNAEDLLAYVVHRAGDEGLAYWQRQPRHVLIE